MIRRGDVVVADFPYVEAARMRTRPALVVSDGPIAAGRLVWVVMITGSVLPSWPLDVSTGAAFAKMGLRRLSVIRVAKITAVEAAATRRIGAAPANVLAQVDVQLRATLGFRAD